MTALMCSVGSVSAASPAVTDDEPQHSAASGEDRIVEWHTQVGPGATVYFPELQCPAGYYLHNERKTDFAGITIPGIEMHREDGWLDVTLKWATDGLAVGSDGYAHLVYTGIFGGDLVKNNASNWFWFTGRWVTLKLHCTTDVDAAKVR